MGYKGVLPHVRPHNLRSAVEQPGGVEEKIKEEIAVNGIAGPFCQPPFSSFRVSGFGADLGITSGFGAEERTG